MADGENVLAQIVVLMAAVLASIFILGGGTSFALAQTWVFATALASLTFATLVARRFDRGVLVPIRFSRERRVNAARHELAKRNDPLLI